MSNFFSRLTVLQIYAIAAGTALVLAAILLFAVIQPKKEQAKKVDDEAAGIENNGGTREKVAQKQRELKKAQEQAEKSKADWARYEAMYMPRLRLDDPDLLRAYSTTLVNIPARWGKFITKWYEAQRNNGISLAPGMTFPIASFPTDPNYISQINHLTFPLDGRPWQVQVEAKSFDQAMAHLDRFNRMQGYGMPVINNVALSGYSPNLLLNYELALYVIPATEPPPQDPTLTGPGAGGRMGGAMGGMMGGMGPMGMMGGGMPGPAGGAAVGRRGAYSGAAGAAGAAPSAGGGGKEDE